MASAKQIAANRRNSLKSTGPRTPAGRVASSLNALKHGLTAAQMVIFDENEKDFTDLVAEVFASFDTVGAAEDELARQVAVCMWNSRRGGRAQAGLFNRSGDHDSGVFHHMPQSMATYIRYDAANSRKQQNLINQLTRMQEIRRGNAVSAPITPTTSAAVETVVAPATALRPANTHSQIALEFPDRAPDSTSPKSAPPQPSEPGTGNCETKPNS